MQSTPSADNKSIHAVFHLNHHNDKSKGFTLDVDITLPGKGITAVFGHSGSGKTTLLRCIAGLENPSRGHFTINGDTWQNDSLFIPTHKRSLGYVFQEASLFSHLTAEGNLNYARKRSDKRVGTDLYNLAIDIMGIQDILQHYPHQLSGGERQRVAIARAILIQPRLLLLDEPLASLDHARKQEILPYLERLGSTLDIPIIFVSHSIDEVARLADYTVVLNKGSVMAHGTLTDVFSRIDLPFGFGDDTGVVLQGEVIERDPEWHLSRIAFSGGELWVRDRGDELHQSVRVRILAKDVSLALTPNENSSILNKLEAQVTDIGPDSDEAMSLIRLKVGSEYIIARLTRRSVAHLELTLGKTVWAQIKSVAIAR